MPTSQVLVILITNPFFSFLILTPAAWSSQLQPPSLDPELISRISGSFGASSCNITISQASVKTPGKINIADFCHFPVKHSPGRARCVPALKIKPQKLVFYYRGVWEFHAASQDPGNLKLQQKPQKTVIFYWGVWEFHRNSVPGRPVRDHLSPGYPQVINNRGVWEFEPNSPLCLVLYRSKYIFDLLPKTPFLFLG